MSSHPDPEQLAAVASGEPVPAGLATHLADCGACTADLAALRGLATDLAAAEAVDWVDPPAAVWAGIEQGLSRATDGPQPSGEIGPTVRPSRRRRWVAVAAAAVIGVIAGVLGGRLLWPAPVTQVVVVASTSLDSLDQGQSLGEASLLRTNGDVELSVRTVPLDPGTGYLEVWLLNTDGVRMISVGVLADNTTGVFPVSSDLLGEGYRIVDVSRELLDDKPAHSGDSLARGELPV